MPEPQPPAGSAEERAERPARRYPAFYERAVPIALGVIGVAIVVLLLIVLFVVLRS